MTKITPKAIIDALTAREGLKKSVSRAQVSEIVGQLGEMVTEDKDRAEDYARVLCALGAARKKRARGKGKGRGRR